MKTKPADPIPAQSAAMAAALSAAFAACALTQDENHPAVKAAIARVVALATEGL